MGRVQVNASLLLSVKWGITYGQFEFTGEYCLTGSIDKACKLWDVAGG